jgi:hypothetical protein
MTRVAQPFTAACAAPAHGLGNKGIFSMMFSKDMKHEKRGSKRITRTLLAGGTAFTMMLSPAISFVATIASAGAASAQSSDDYDQGPPASHAKRVPAGTEIKVKLTRDVSSSSAESGDHVRAYVAPDDTSGLPTGTMFIGQVTDAVPATPKNGGQLALQFALPTDATPSNGDGQPAQVADDASATLEGHSAHGSGHIAGIAAGAGALLGFVRKRKFGDTVEGAAIGGVGGEAVDQSQKRSASDVDLKKDDEITIKLDRPLLVKTIVTPDNY